MPSGEVAVPGGTPKDRKRADQGEHDARRLRRRRSPRRRRRRRGGGRGSSCSRAASPCAHGETGSLLEVGGDPRVGRGVVDRRAARPMRRRPQSESEPRIATSAASPRHGRRSRAVTDAVWHRQDSTNPAAPMRVLILGGDGYLGWPTALRFSARGHEVSVVDNFVRRRWDRERGQRLADPDPRPRAADRGLGGGLRQRDPQLRRRRRGRRLPRRRRRRDPARGGRPLRPAGLGALLDGLARAGGRDPARAT